MTTTCELPKWQCHKQVRADRIIFIEVDERAGVVDLYLASGVMRSVTPQWVEKHNPQRLGYFVEYEDGYESYSPAEPFEKGYSRIGDQPLLRYPATLRQDQLLIGEASMESQV